MEDMNDLYKFILKMKKLKNKRIGVGHASFPP
jgi:hypothetical protein